MGRGSKYQDLQKLRWESIEALLKNEIAIVTTQVNSVEATMALLEKSSEGRVTAATAMNKVNVTSDHLKLFESGSLAKTHFCVI